MIWHVHGSWSTAFVQGRHHYLLPVLPERGSWGGGRPRAWEWPASAVEVPVDRLRDAEADVVVLQRPEELELARRWLGREPGGDLPAVYVEHNAPRGDVPCTRHLLADRADVTLVHVTHFNALMWDSGRAPTAVVEHGVADPGHRYTGELDAAAVVVNEPVRRGRVTGTDLLPRFAAAARLDVFGMGLSGLDDAAGRITAVGDLPQRRLHAEMARRRIYLHPQRWTSLGLSLIEAMALGMPVVALATTEAVAAVPPEAGVISTDVEVLTRAVADLVADPERARQMGKHAREAALVRHGLHGFLCAWDEVLERVVSRRRTG